MQLLPRTFSFSTDSMYVKCVGYDLNVSHRCHVRNHLHKNKISQIMCRYVYDVSPYKFHIPRSNVSLIIAIRPEAKEDVTMIAILLFYILQKHLF